MELSRASLNQGGTVLTGMPSSAQDHRRDAAGWETTASSIPNVPNFREEIKVSWEGAWWIYSAVVLDIAARLYADGAAGGG